MPGTTIEQQIVATLASLPADQQRRVLDFARALAHTPPPGVPGTALLQFAGAIPLDDLEEIARVIETGCEQVDHDEW